MKATLLTFVSILAITIAAPNPDRAPTENLRPRVDPEDPHCGKYGAPTGPNLGLCIRMKPLEDCEWCCRGSEKDNTNKECHTHPDELCIPSGTLFHCGPMH